ncbi:antirepressor [Mycobacterium phage Mask]|nr:antirepressor [Mycobacterium phage Mask]
MNNPIAHTGDRSPFDAIRRTRPDGSEFWSARDLMPLLGYGKWENFAASIERALTSAGNSGAEQAISRRQEMVAQGGATRTDYDLSRFGAYLVAMNGDPRKAEVAAAQAYFAIRTREAETQSNIIALPSRRELAQMVIEAEDRADREAAARIEAESRARELEVPASAWKHMASSDGDYMVRDAAKVLSRDPNIEIGQQRLFKFMQAEGWIYRENGAWKPYQTQIQTGRLAEKLNRPFLNERTGEMEVPAPSVRITPKGLAELHKRLGGSGQLATVAAS